MGGVGGGGYKSFITISAKVIDGEWKMIVGFGP